MSYRAFKRLLGETSLERKCRFLFGIGILVLITLSFWLYAYQTEHLAYEQATTSARLLVPSLLAQNHVTRMQALDAPKLEGEALKAALDLSPAFLDRDKGTDYQYTYLYSTVKENKQGDSFERDLHKDFLKGEVPDATRLSPSEHTLFYYTPIRAEHGCVQCHQALASRKGMAPVAEGDLMAMMRIRLSTKAIEEGVHWNRAILMATALGTAILIMAGSWIIVRYIIVKPVLA